MVLYIIDLVERDSASRLVQNLNGVFRENITRSTPHSRRSHHIPATTVSKTSNNTTLKREKRRMGKDALHDCKCRRQIDAQDWCCSCQTNQGQLKKGVVFADGGRSDFGGRQRKVPVSGECLGRRQRDPAVVDGCDGQSDISAQDDACDPN